MEFPEDVWREIVSFSLPLSVGCLRKACVENGIELDVKHKMGDARYIYCVIYVTSASDFVSRLVAGKMTQVDKIYTCARHTDGTFKVHFTAWFNGKTRKEVKFGREEAYYLVGSNRGNEWWSHGPRDRLIDCVVDTLKDAMRS